MEQKELETFYPVSLQKWREWLQENHEEKQSIWLVCYKMKSGIPSISWSDAVDQALCFGWIDSTRKSIDDQQFIQFYTKRKPKSAWSKINKDKVDRLIAEDLMMPAGYKSIEIAKQNGSWSSMDRVEELEVPKDLSEAFKLHAGSEEYFSSLSKSVKKMMLYWIAQAKRPETKQKRIDEIVTNAAMKQKPKQF